MPQDQELSIFSLGDFQLDSGEVITDAFLAYKTFGDPRTPAILHPTAYGSTTQDVVQTLSTTRGSLNPTKYFIIIPGLIGSGQSVSPSNHRSLRNSFPTVRFSDNVRAQYRLVTERLGLTHLKAVVGFSMGGAQAYQWAVQYPDFMDVIVPICSSARTSVHNRVFLEGVKSALIAAKGGLSSGVGKGQTFPDSKAWSDEQKACGLKAFARVYAGWGMSQAFYREKLHVSQSGAADEEDFIVNVFEAWAAKSDPEDLLVMLQTWQLGDISASDEFGGDLEKALQSIKAKVLLCPGKTDLYFPPEDSEAEVKVMGAKAALKVIPSIWGHWAGGAGAPVEDQRFLDEVITEAFNAK